MKPFAVIAMVLLTATPAFAGKSCYFKDAEGTCIDKDDVEPIHLIKKGTPYAAVSQRLQALGYTPGRGPYAGDAMRCTANLCDLPPEMVTCSGYDCQFLFNKGGSHYLVHTHGKGMSYAGASFMSDQAFAAMRPQ